jgi:hypothetical protein
MSQREQALKWWHSLIESEKNTYSFRVAPTGVQIEEKFIENVKNRFKEFCNGYISKGKTTLEDIDWYGMSIGFFLGCGLSLDESIDVALNVYKNESWY